MHSYAQTNLQLYGQLRRAEWDDASLALTRRAYELATETCGAIVRPNGKPFLCHLVGTASIVASWAASIDEVVCGLVHSVYTHGSFPDERPGPTDEKRAVVRRVIGPDSESLVASYTELGWSAAAIAGLAARAESLSRSERCAVRVRLANELEDHLDLGMRHARKTKPADRADAVHLLADALVGSAFARELEETIAANAGAVVPDVLVSDAESSFNTQRAHSQPRS